MTYPSQFGPYAMVAVRYEYCSDIEQVPSGSHKPSRITLEKVTIREIVLYGKKIRTEHEPTPAQVLGLK